MSNSEMLDNLDQSSIAIIGMTGRFPGARTVEDFWNNLRDGFEAISLFTDDELEDAGTQREFFHHPKFVRAGGVLSGVELFDAGFFGFSPREAEVMDPQHRLFLECAWEAMENAGYDSESYGGTVGVFAGSALSTYMMNLVSTTNILEIVGIAQTLIANANDYLTTRVSYKLNLRGPSIDVQTACSTSLVAVHLACQNLLNGECHIALAGGVTIINPQKAGYWYQEGGILSPDGHCRAFDAKAQGTIGGNGVGIVVLKRLVDAVADGDTIHAVIRGSAINNDGAHKVGYTAPSVSGQSEVIGEAQAIAGVDPETITYVEAHGTATPLGDPVEMQALKQAFEAQTERKKFCGVGSVKTNIGHLDTAAGVAGLIKTVLALKHRQIPPSLNYEEPNPNFDLENSPFYINAALRDWPRGDTPRRAGVSSFGIGGTNAHLILEEAPELEDSGASRTSQLLLLSAKTATALDAATINLLDYLQKHRDVNLADVAYTLQVGRRAFNHRRMLVCTDTDHAMRVLEQFDPEHLKTNAQENRTRPVVFMFSGQGAQYVNMARELYEQESVFREQVDLCAQVLQTHLSLDLREVLYPAPEHEEQAVALLCQTRLTQPALFVIEYALAQMWMSWGITPQSMIGHSIGEYVAACLAGVFSLEHALMLVAVRGALMQEMPVGEMLAVPLSEEKLRPLLSTELSLAAVNAPSLTVASGTTEAIAGLRAKLALEELEGRLLHTSHAFHSAMMEPMLERFVEQFGKVKLEAPRVPFISNLTGTWITDEQATDTRYWARHLRQTVRFADGVRELLRTSEAIFLELGPGQTLGTFVRQQPLEKGVPARTVLATVRHPREQQTDLSYALNTLGQLWLGGVRINWQGFYEGEKRRRIPLPTYPFERQRYWLDPSAFTSTVTQQPALRKKTDITQWFYQPVWKHSRSPVIFERGMLEGEKKNYLVFLDEHGFGSQIVTRLEDEKQHVITVSAGREFARTGERAFTLDPRASKQYMSLLTELEASESTPQVIVHCWGMGNENLPAATEISLERDLLRSFYSLLYLSQAYVRQHVSDELRLVVLSNEMQEVTGEEELQPLQATALGLCKVIPQEHPNITCRSLDVQFPRDGSQPSPELIDSLVADIVGASPDPVVAYRGRLRWAQIYEAAQNGTARGGRTLLREGGVYLITGGLGRIGLLLAEHLARTVKAKLILVGRSPLPAREDWAAWLASHAEDDELSRRMRAVESLEYLGAEVLLAHADVANEEEMRDVLFRALSRFGALHGVIHAVAGKAIAPLQETGAAECESHFRPKVQGLLVLEKVLRGQPLDFYLLLSSLASVLGGLGFAAYSAANNFMDAFARRNHSPASTCWISVDLDGWRFAEQTETSAPQAMSHTELTMTPKEGLEVLQRAISRSAAPQSVVSTGDLQTRINQWIKLESLRDDEGTPTTEESRTLHERPEIANPYVAPTTETELVVAGIWQQLLGIERIGIEDNFFELGGHSLLATQVVSRLRKAFQVEVPLRSILEAPTVAGMAASIEAEQLSARGVQAPPILAAARDRNLPLSFAQQRLWFLDRLEPNNPFYNLSTAFRLSGRLDIDAVKQSLNEVVRRHEALRTTIADAGGEAVQVIAPTLDIELPVIDLSTLPHTEREPRIRRLAEEEAQRAFDLARGPLLRAFLLRVEDEEHVMLFTLHHIVSDGWSMGVLVQEVTTLYEAYSTGQPSPLPELPLQYADFAVWQREWLQGEVLDDQLQYWRQKLGGDLPVLELPTDHPRPPVQSFRGKHQFISLSEDLSRSLKELGRREGATEFMTYLAAFKALLYRYTGQEDILIGTPSANRNRAETESIIGFFINTLVLRTQVDGELSFRKLLGRVREVTLDAYTHQDMPFDMLVMELQPDRNLNRMPIFQVAFNIYNFPSPSLEIPGLRLSPVEADSGAMPYDLILTIRDVDEGVIVGLGYNTDLFESGTIAVMLQHFRTLLANIAAEPDQCVSEVPLLAEAEEQQMLVAWNDTRLDYEATAATQPCIHSLCEAQASRTPDATALMYEEVALTYAELNARANQLARYLCSIGVGPEVRVGICVDRSIEMVVGLLGILKTGGAYVPLDAAYPQERLGFMLEDAEVTVLLTQRHLIGALPEHEAKIVFIDEDSAHITQQAEENLNTPLTPDNLAYVIYTSGSTGKPKGVMVSHRAICNRLLWMLQLLQPDASDRVLQKTPYSFDASLWELFLPLFSGAQLVMARPGGHRDPAYLVEAVCQHRITILQLVPSMLRVFLGEESVGQCDSLRHMFCGGERLTADDRQRFDERLPHATLHNLYGPTEASIDATHWQCEKDSDSDVVPIGRPIANVQVYVLNHHLQPVPVGTAGELHISGVGLARGYLNRAELTAEKFIPNPFGSEAGGRLYRTGDVVKYLADGRIVYVGRGDHQVKLRGFRIEVGEIEVALRQQIRVQTAIVVVRDDEHGNQRLVAYVVPEKDARFKGVDQPLYRLPNNLEIVHHNRSETDVVYKEVFDDGGYLRHGVTILDGDCVFDIGANIGLFTLFVHQQCRNPRVFSFEPIPPTFELLETNIKLHGLNAKAYLCGISSETRMAEFTFYPEASATSGMYADAAEEEKITRAFIGNQGELGSYADELLEGRFAGVTYQCQLRTVSELISENGIEQIDLLKVDVEKSELDVLEGIGAEDWSKIRQIVMEVHDSEGRLEAVTAMLKQHGFEFVVEQDEFLKNTSLYNIYAVHPSAATRASRTQQNSKYENSVPELWSAVLSADELRSELERKLPEYMIPTAFVMLDELPLLPNGKLNLSALPPPEEAKHEAVNSFEPPRTPVEEVLTEIWGGVLGAARPGVHDNFFDLGGHSLLAMQVMSRIRAAFHLDLRVRALFESPTISALAENISRMSQAAGNKSLAGADSMPTVLMRVEREARMPLSYRQEHLWTLENATDTEAAQQTTTIVRIKGRLKAETLANVLREVVMRHETLRTKFVADAEGKPQQVIAEVFESDLLLIDVGETPAAELEAKLQSLAKAHALRDAQQAAVPSFRASLVKISEQEHVLLLTTHRMAADEWSRIILLQELAASYGALSAKRESALPELAIQYADYAYWQRQWLESEAAQSHFDYWRGILESAPVLALPVKRKSEANAASKTARQKFVIASGLTETLKALGRQEEATLFMTLLAAFQALLSHYTNQHDLVIGTDVPNRDLSEVRGLIGPCTNQLALRTDLSGNPTFRELLKRVRAVTFGAYTHQYIPWEELQATMGAQVNELMRVKLVQTNALPRSLRSESLTLEPSTLAFDGTDKSVSLLLDACEDEHQIFAGIEYDPDRFTTAFIEQMREDLSLILQRAGEQPNATLSELLKPLADAEKQRGFEEEQALEEASLKALQGIRRRSAAKSKSGRI